MAFTPPTLKRTLPLLFSLIIADLLILATDLSLLRLISGLALVFVLPGWVWLAGLNWLQTNNGLERITLTVGASAALAATTLLFAAYWPGPLSVEAVVVALNGMSLLGGVFWLLPKAGGQRSRGAEEQGSKSPPPPRPPAPHLALTWPDRQTTLLLLLILAVGAYLRFAHLGYAEFHEDALENMRLAVRAMKGEEFAPFLDSKGPVHWLLPGALWLTNGWLSEGIARLPFAIMGFFNIMAVFALAHRLTNSNTIALTGAALTVINGFFIAYARHVENPTLIVLWGTLAFWCAYHFYQHGVGAALVLGAFFLTIGLITHPNVLLYLPPFGLMILIAFWRKPRLRKTGWKAALAGLLIFIVLSASFYMPYLRDPSLERTREYFAAERIGTEFLYNGLATMLDQTKNYSTRYYGPFLILFSGIFLFGEVRKVTRWGWLLALLLFGAAATTVFFPALWQWGEQSGAFVPFALLFLILTLAPRTSFEHKSLIWWFAVPFLAMEFLAKDASDHIQIAYVAWAILAAVGFRQTWHWLAGKPGERLIKVAGVAAMGLLLGLVLYYQNLEFLGQVSTYRRLEADAKFNETSIFRWLYGGLPRPRKLHGNPRLGGWKVVGTLYDQGVLRGDFRSVDESFAVPIWYTYQTPRSCFTDPDHYFVSLKSRDRPEALDQIMAQGYGLTRIVRIDGRLPMLYLLEKNTPPADPPEVLDVDDFRAIFDRTTTPERYSRAATGQHPQSLDFGGKLLLQGYDANTTTLKPGQTLAVNLYWKSLAPMDIRYRAFVHVETDRMWGQHDDDPACRLRTDEWRPDQEAVGQFRVTLAPDTPPGTYPVTVGLYHPETWERFEITGGAGQVVGNQVTLFTIAVE